MIEAVGERYWPTYFAALDRLLARAAGSGCRRSPCRTTGCSRRAAHYTWIHKYVFPGGLIPSIAGDRAAPGAAHRRCGSPSSRGLGPALRPDARALAGAASSRHWEAVAALGFDDTFRRMWEFYLAYCEAGFRAGYLDVIQFCLARP